MSYLFWVNEQLNKIKKNKFSEKKNFTLESILEKKINKKDLALEFGVFKGGTCNLISNYVKKIYGFDSFNGLPEDWKGVTNKGTFKLDNLPEVNDNVMLIKGLFNDTLDNFLKNNNEYFKLIHIDCDLYSSTKFVFEKLVEYNKLLPGTIIVFDEIINYQQFMEGELKALYELNTINKINFEWIGTHGKNILLPKNINKHKDWTFSKFRRNGYQQEAAIIII